MTIEEYLVYFEDVLNYPEQHVLYQDAEYYNYTKLNWSRMNRWFKRFVVAEELKLAIERIKIPQRWIIITEPWCGDAAHTVPQLVQLARLNSLITLEIQLRDAEPFLIHDYLTNGGKSIPKLIIRDENEKDRAVWGPRPAVLQDVFEQMKEDNVPFEEVKEAFQKWYNEDKGSALQAEVLGILNSYEISR